MNFWQQNQILPYPCSWYKAGEGQLSALFGSKKGFAVTKCLVLQLKPGRKDGTSQEGTWTYMRTAFKLLPSYSEETLLKPNCAMYLLWVVVALLVDGSCCSDENVLSAGSRQEDFRLFVERSRMVAYKISRVCKPFSMELNYRVALHPSAPTGYHWAPEFWGGGDRWWGFRLRSGEERLREGRAVDPRGYRHTPRGR